MKTWTNSVQFYISRIASPAEVILGTLSRCSAPSRLLELCESSFLLSYRYKSPVHVTPASLHQEIKMNLGAAARFD